ncbi:MAG: Crp/Fnr family transcriptional regulator [Saprospiraceae bacterium]
MNELKSLLRKKFPVFAQNELVEIIVERSTFLKLPKKTELLSTGAIINVVPLVLKGLVEVFRENENGREILLYRISEGESCAVTMCSCFKREKSFINAKILEETELLAVPVELIRQLHENYPCWSNFVFNTFTLRFGEVLAVLEDNVFLTIQDRLGKYLRTKSHYINDNTLLLTHNEIAKELVTSREVISRILKDMEKKGLIQLHRKRIILTGLLHVRIPNLGLN